MNRTYHQWFSPNLQRNMELLVFGNGGRAVLFFPPRMGRFYDYENWGIVGALYDKLVNGELQLFCVDSFDAESFYNKDIDAPTRLARHLHYEAYIIQEVMPFMWRMNGSYFMEAAGCSMGAYHAVNLTFKHPQYFNRVVGMSGRYDLTQKLEYYDDLFDGHWNDDVYFNSPQQFIPNLTDGRLLNVLRQIDITLAVGHDDPFCPANQAFSSKLRDRQIPHRLYLWDGVAHRPRFWRQMVQWYL
jgi:esterase/lipase superfamily enzyme